MNDGVIISSILAGGTTITAAILKMIPRRSPNGVVKKESCELIHAALDSKIDMIRGDLKDDISEIKTDVKDVLKALKLT